MGTYEVLQPVSLTVEPGSIVILSEMQYQLAKNNLRPLPEELPLVESPTDTKPLRRSAKAERPSRTEKQGIEVAQVEASGAS